MRNILKEIFIKRIGLANLHQPEWFNLVITGIVPMRPDDRIRLWKFKTMCRKACAPVTSLRDFCELP